jgi:toxin YoeB
MNLLFAGRAWEDYLHWQDTDRKLVRKINELIKAIDREPFSGIGKPEPLRHEFAGYWSRRITGEHRLIYKVEDGRITIVQIRFHYR